MEFKGQGALEYLLMIGAGVAIAGIVLYFVFFSGQTMICNNFKQQVAQQCAQLPEARCIPQYANVTNEVGDPASNPAGLDCTWNSSTETCDVRAGVVWAASDYCD